MLPLLWVVTKEISCSRLERRQVNAPKAVPAQNEDRVGAGSELSAWAAPGLPECFLNDRVCGRLVERGRGPLQRRRHLDLGADRGSRTQVKSQVRQSRVAGTRWVDSGLVFTTLEGRPLGASHVVSGSFRRICDRADIAYGTASRRGLRFHDLRHSCASLLLAQRIAPRTVMEILGHSQIGITMNRYTHVPSVLMGEAAAAMDRALGS